MLNAGQIGYVELDGDPLNNMKGRVDGTINDIVIHDMEVFEKLVRFMHDNDMGYFALSHAVDRCPMCGFTGVIKDECPQCHYRDKEKKDIGVINRL